MKSTVLIVMGVSGTGKTTIGRLLSKTYDYPFFDGDDYHPKENIAKMSAGNPLNDNDRQGWLERLNGLALQHSKSGAIIACSALKEYYREILKKGIANDIAFIYLKGSFEQIKKRLENRKNHFMSTTLLQSQFDTLEEPSNAIEISILLSPSEIVAAIEKRLENP